MKRLLSLLLVFSLLLSMVIYVDAADYGLPEFLKNRSVLFTQKTSHNEDKNQNLSDGVYMPGWYPWLTHGVDGFSDLYDALSTDGAEMVIKFKGEASISASFTHWGSASGVGCTEIVEEGGFKYAIFDKNAVKSMFTNYANNNANIDENGNVKTPNAMSIDCRYGDSGNTIYGLWVLSGVVIDPALKYTAVVDMDKTFQTIDGWGASYTWYSDWMVGLPCAEQGYDWIFNDAQFNILRFRDQHGLSGDEKNEPLKGYPKYKGYYDAAVERGITPTVLVTSWGQYDRSLPWVAYTEKSEKGFSYYTLAKDENGEYMYDELADFCVQSVQYFFDAGIPVDYFSISNEIELQERHVDEQGNARSDAGFFFGQTETDDYCAYWKAHLAVYDAFQEAFGDKAPSIIGAETMAADKGYLKGYLDPVIERNPEAFDVVAHHLYGSSLSSSNFASIYNEFSDYRLWQTEWYEHDYMYLGDVILNELINENITAYLYWNGVWVEDTGNCLIEIDTFYNWATIKRNGGHYVMSHFSRYIKPGYQRVDVTEYLDSRVGAFKSPDGEQLVVVVANNTDTEETLEIDCGYKYSSSVVRQSVEATGEYFKAIDSGFTQGMTIPAGSLTTIVLNLDGVECDHTSGTWTKHDETQHKKTCKCGQVQYEDHSWNSGVTTTAATIYNSGVKTYTCTVCNETKTEVIPKIDTGIADGMMGIFATSHKAVKGDEVEVTFILLENKGLASLKGDIVYDKNVFTLTDVSPAQGYNSLTLNGDTVSWSGTSTGVNGNIFTATFSVNEAAETGIYNIGFNFLPADITDAAGVPIEADYAGGKLSVIKYVPGDINGDEVVNITDVLRLAKYVAGWEVEVIFRNLDVNYDKGVNISDVLRLAKHVAGWDVEIYGNTVSLVDKATPTENLGLSVSSTLSQAYKGVSDTNPISSNLFFADPTSIVYNGRLYVYGTNDTVEYVNNLGTTEGNDYGSIDSLVCYSTEDMINWRFEQIIPVGDIATWASCSWAPSIVSRVEDDGLTHFYLYFANNSAGVGVLTATSPTGPWTDPLGHAIIDYWHPYITEDPITWCFDPGVVIDDNGVGWLTFGGGSDEQEGHNGLYTGNSRIVKLNDDLISMDGKPVVVDVPYHFEANELNYVNGTYIWSYCTNWCARDEWPAELGGSAPDMCIMCYMTSTDPLDPDSWEYQGAYVYNPVAYGYWFSNNHTHINEFNGKYYLFYQNVLLLQNMNYEGGGGYRSNNVVPISVDEQTGKLSLATMSTKSVDQLKNISSTLVTQAEEYSVGAGVSYISDDDRVSVSASDGNWTQTRGVSFGSGVNTFAANVSGNGIIEIRLDSTDGPVVGNIQFNNSQMSAVSCTLTQTVSGVHDLYFVFGGNVVFDSWQFAMK